MKITFLILVLLVCLLSHAEDIDSSYAKAMSAVRESQSDATKLIPAIKLLVEVEAKLEASGDTERAVVVNSCLYWAKKRMTLADTEKIKPSVGTIKRLDTASLATPASSAAPMLEKATKFAKANQSDHLAIAMVYFEIADRFPQTEEGRIAMGLSLQEMQKLQVVQEYIPTAMDGKAYVKTEPSGATVTIIKDDKRQRLGKTPCTVSIPLGTQRVEIDMEGFESTVVSLEIKEKEIAKAIVKMSRKRTQVDIVFDADWMVFVDGDYVGKNTPCILQLEPGRHEVSLAKIGFQDITEKVAVANQPINFESKQQAVQGNSVKIASLKTLVIWNCHNGRFNNVGTKSCTVSLKLGDKTVWKKDLSWEKDEANRKEVSVPSSFQFDKVRIDIVSFDGYCGGLSEVELMVGGRNIAKNAKCTGTQHKKNDTRTPQMLTDGNTSDAGSSGFWLGPFDGSAGWVEIDLNNKIK